MSASDDEYVQQWRLGLERLRIQTAMHQEDYDTARGLAGTAKPANPFAIGDSVYRQLWRPHLSADQRLTRFTGPFSVQRVLSAVTVRIVDQEGKEYVENIRRLKKVPVTTTTKSSMDVEVETSAVTTINKDVEVENQAVNDETPTVHAAPRAEIVDRQIAVLLEAGFITRRGQTPPLPPTLIRHSGPKGDDVPVEFEDGTSMRSAAS
jgi:hypothetical protein